MSNYTFEDALSLVRNQYPANSAEQQKKMAIKVLETMEEFGSAERALLLMKEY